MAYILLKPQVQAASLTPNPVAANTGYKLAVLVIEIEVTLEPLLRYCGTFYCGEEGGLS